MMTQDVTCKDRWRQILNEADRISTKYLLTIQEGVSKNQFYEMKDAGVVLVVPQKARKKYPVEFRNEILSVKEFIALVTR